MAAIAALALPAMAQAQVREPLFNLQCGNPVVLTYRFDLNLQKWCVQSCQKVFAIDKIYDQKIIMDSINPTTHDHYITTIDRYTGVLSTVHVGYGDAPQMTIQCKRTPFTGFPNRMF